MYILMKYKSDFKKYSKYEDEIYKNILFVVCFFVCLLVCLFVCLIPVMKNDLNYKLNILGPLCLWQCFNHRLLAKYPWEVSLEVLR